MNHATETRDSCTVKTTCPYCGVGCGVSAEIKNDQLIAVSGDTEHPANLGKLCVKGATLDQTMGNHGRLLQPSIEGHPVSWDRAIEEVACRLNQVREKYGPEAIAFYLSGQLLTEDYYVANKLAKGFIGTGHVDTNSRLCMSSAVAGYKRAFGADAVPCNYEDLEHCELLVLTGSNAAWTHPVLYRRIAAAKQKNPAMRVVVIDPRRTASCDLADLHLAVAPGADAFIFNGLLAFLDRADQLDRHYIEQHTEGFAAALETASAISQAELEQQTGISREELATFYQWFVETEKSITFYSMGINQSATGTDKCNAIINCHLATGRIGKLGAGPFSITGQPNAMGGREVGGLANMLAAHMDYTPENVATVSAFWNSDKVSKKAGLKAVDLFDAVADGSIKAIWIMGTNPVVSMPNADRVKAALEHCETVIVSDCIAETDTTATANILLPAAGWGEKSGTVTNSERRISRQRALVSAAGEARADWWILAQVAKAMGFSDGFNYQSPRDVFVEHAQLSDYQNQGQRLFNIGALSQLSETHYDSLQPIQWPVTTNRPQGTTRLFEDGQFVTPSGRARFIAITPRLPAKRKSQRRYPLALNSGRIRDQWHTMTRTGRAASLLDHTDQPFVAMHPDTAAAADLQNGDLAEVSTLQGAIQVISLIDLGVKPEQLFVPIHWSNQNAHSARVATLFEAIIDPVSGQPESKFSRAALKKIESPCWATLVSRTALDCSEFINWTSAALPRQLGFIYQVAVSAEFNWQHYASKVTGATAYAQFSDAANFDQRLIGYSDQQMEIALFSHRQKPSLPNKAWMQDLLNNRAPENYWRLLSGPDLSLADSGGKLICSCFKVSEAHIISAIETGADSTEQLGKQLQCGTNCGSCIPELSSLIKQVQTSSQFLAKQIG
ncbi:nitrate reductase [Porticoccaceae bacterium]|nr:nitrate reductase [Porticoccaceae bacterium]